MIYIYHISDDVAQNINYRRIFKCTFISFLFEYELQVLKELFYASLMQVFVNLVERLNGPVYSVPPCIYCIIALLVIIGYY